MSLTDSLTSKVLGIPAWVLALAIGGGIYWFAHRRSTGQPLVKRPPQANSHQMLEPNPNYPSNVGNTMPVTIAPLSGGTSFINPSRMVY